MVYIIFTCKYIFMYDINRSLSQVIVLSKPSKVLRQLIGCFVFTGIDVPYCFS